MSRVLVTGGSGFIGRHALPALLRAGHEVFAVSHERETPAEGVTWLAADLLDSTAHDRLMARVKPDLLLHLAWYAVPGKFWIAAENREWTAASRSLIQAFAAAGGRRLVVAGTCAEYDFAAGVCDEASTPLRPATLYGEEKNALRAWLEEFAGRGTLQWAWGRVFWLFGPHEHPDRLVAHVIRSLLRGEPAQVSSGEQKRDFLHVADVAGAFAALLTSEASGPVNVCSGEAVSVRAIVEQIAARLQRPQLVRFGGLPTQGPPLVMGRNEKLRGAGWRPAFDLETGLEDAIAWWRGALGAHA